MSTLKNYIIPEWPAPNVVKAFTTTRQHHIPSFSNFNLPEYAGDVDAVVIQLKKDLHLPNAPAWINQVHGNHVVCADHDAFTAADASYTNKPGIVCVVLTADCLPILLCNQEGTQIAAVHAGWRGLAANIIENTLKITQMEPKKTLAWLGPAIGPTVFEVGTDVQEKFLQADSAAEKAFVPLANKENKFLANIYTLAKQRLAKLGVTQIYGGKYCTYTDSELFYSYRRDHGKTGRMASLIWITKKS